ncbi:hypothetical protein Tco_0489420 [Tanacetum coccineum]
MYLVASMESISAVLLTERKKTSSYLPLKQGIKRGRIKVPRAGETHTSPQHDIEFKGRDSVKGQVLADFLAEMPSVEGEDKETKKHQTPNEESKPEDMWKLYTDKDSSSDGSGVSFAMCWSLSS